MNITDSLQGVTRLFLDTAPVIYYIERNPQYFALVSVVFNHIANSGVMGVASPVTLAECLVLPAQLGQIQVRQDFIELLTETDGIEFVEIDQTIAGQTAQIRARHNLQLPDAFQVAVALYFTSLCAREEYLSPSIPLLHPLTTNPKPQPNHRKMSLWGFVHGEG